MLTVDNGDLLYGSVGLALLIGLVIGVIVTVAVVLIEGLQGTRQQLQTQVALQRHRTHPDTPQLLVRYPGLRLRPTRRCARAVR